MNNKKNTVWALMISAAAVLSLLLCFSAGKCDALVLGLDRDAQKDLFPQFFSEIKAGDYDQAMEHVANYETLGFEKESTELVELYKSRLTQSYSVSVIDHNSGNPQGLNGQQIIEVTFLDSRRLLSAINEKTSVTVNDYLYTGSKLESDEQALSFVYDALNECLSAPENYLSTERLVVQTVFEDGRWQIVIDDAFLDVLHGHISSAAAGVTVSDSDVASGSDAAASNSDAHSSEEVTDYE